MDNNNSPDTLLLLGFHSATFTAWKSFFTPKKSGKQGPECTATEQSLAKQTVSIVEGRFYCSEAPGQ